MASAAWLTASAAGLAVGLPVGLVLGAPLEVVVGMMLVTPVMLALAGAVLGTSQWLVLRDELERSWLWIVSSALGMSIGMTAGVVVVETVGRLITGGQVRLADTGPAGLAASLVVLGLLGGFAVGAAQWAYVRRRHDASSGWIVTNAAALPAGFLTGLLVATVGFGSLLTPAGAIAFLAVSGLIYGGITSRLLRQLGVSAAAS